MHTHKGKFPKIAQIMVLGITIISIFDLEKSSMCRTFDADLRIDAFGQLRAASNTGGRYCHVENMAKYDCQRRPTFRA